MSTDLAVARPTDPPTTTRFTWGDLAIVLVVGVGLANAPVADFLALGPALLGASELLATSLAWLLINGIQLLVGLGVTYRRFGVVAAPLLLTRPRGGQLRAAVGWGLAKAALTLGLLLALPVALTADGGGEGGYPPGSLLAQFTFAFFFGAIASPVYEEVLYRGVFFQGLAARLPTLAAITVSAGFFAVMHLPRVFNTISALVAGLLFAWLLHRHRNLWVPILAHTVSNGVLVVLAFAAQAG
ncbi:CPBP family intramembrane metalloprotease [Micromonospora sp. HM134]|uniref:CPBP family intramembrane glutamic endopeptidase n=1 Tax=unclassified Micromonospora TaxID=2617518 RepID=UPI001198CB3B|nr:MULTISPECIES: CPBP family intramembrane glutamic endopeptidase [unclassified Micromonospora]QDY10713.1 CPBP family intramembrane metalloprotease [Micromonospora sp. HM134]